MAFGELVREFPKAFQSYPSLDHLQFRRVLVAVELWMRKHAADSAETQLRQGCTHRTTVKSHTDTLSLPRFLSNDKILWNRAGEGRELLGVFLHL